MKALLILNNENVRNCRVLVEITQERLKKRIIGLLEKDQGAEAFDVFFKKAEVRAYYPGEKPIPEIPQLITLDEQLLKSKGPKKEQDLDFPSGAKVLCYNN